MSLFQRSPPAASVAETQDYGAYRILRREDGDLWLLGSGAMGLTYRAEDLHLHRPVALKLISPLLTGSREARELFLAEARAAASLRHRNVAAVHHLGTLREEFFYVMEFVEGETVETLVRRQGRLETAFALDIAQQTACALAAASQRRLVHRDLKPANLMLTDEGDGTLVVKVIDFGLSKTFGPVPAAARRAAGRDAPGDGGFFGTPHFASPEQIRNDPGVDGRADFYSLGATLWQMLTGRPPFAGPLALVREQHLRRPPPFEQLPAGLAGPVVTLLARLLAKDPADRPPTPAELIDEIEGAAFASKAQDPRKTWKVDGCVPLLGTVLAHNYHLEALVSDEADGPVFRAEDVAGQRLVAVKLFARAAPLDPVRDAVARLAGAPHPNLLDDREVSSCRGQPFLVSEWVNGFSLADVLRVRGALTPAETQSLVHQAARALDHARENALGTPDLRPAAAMVQFTGEALDAEARRTLPGRPLEGWPAFLLKLRLLARGSAGAAGAALEPAALVRTLGRFAAELLGNPGTSTLAPPTAESPAPPPLPGVPRAISAVLGRAAAGTPGFASGSEFAAALTRAVSGR